MAMTDDQVRAELERIKKGVDIHVSWLKEKTGEWESHSMGIPVKDIVLLLDTLAESQQALGEIMNEQPSIWASSKPDPVVMTCPKCEQLIEIARKHYKGGSNG